MLRVNQDKSQLQKPVMDSVMLNLHSGVIVQFPASIASIKQQQLKVRTAVSSPKGNEFDQTRPRSFSFAYSDSNTPSSSFPAISVLLIGASIAS